MSFPSFPDRNRSKPRKDGGALRSARWSVLSDMFGQDHLEGAVAFSEANFLPEKKRKQVDEARQRLDAALDDESGDPEALDTAMLSAKTISEAYRQSMGPRAKPLAKPDLGRTAAAAYVDPDQMTHDIAEAMKPEVTAKERADRFGKIGQKARRSPVLTLANPNPNAPKRLKIVEVSQTPPPLRRAAEQATEAAKLTQERAEDAAKAKAADRAEKPQAEAREAPTPDTRSRQPGDDQVAELHLGQESPAVMSDAPSVARSGGEGLPEQQSLAAAKTVAPGSPRAGTQPPKADGRGPAETPDSDRALRREVALEKAEKAWTPAIDGIAAGKVPEDSTGLAVRLWLSQSEDFDGDPEKDEDVADAVAKWTPDERRRFIGYQASNEVVLGERADAIGDSVAEGATATARGVGALLSALAAEPESKGPQGFGSMIQSVLATSTAWAESAATGESVEAILDRRARLRDGLVESIVRGVAELPEDLASLPSNARAAWDRTQKRYADWAALKQRFRRNQLTLAELQDEEYRLTRAFAADVAVVGAAIGGLPTRVAATAGQIAADLGRAAGVAGAVASQLDDSADEADRAEAEAAYEAALAYPLAEDRDADARLSRLAPDAPETPRLSAFTAALAEIERLRAEIAAAPKLDDRAALRIGKADPKVVALQRAQERRDDLGAELALAYEAAIWDAAQNRDLEDPKVLADIERAAQAADAVLLRIDIPSILSVRLPAIRKDWWNAPLYRGRRELVGTGPFAKRATRAFHMEKGVGGHHVLSKKVWEDVLNSNRYDDFSLSERFMDEHGIDHRRKITPQQNREYRTLAKKGIEPTGWREVKIAQRALIAGGATEDLSRLLVILALRNKRRQGVKKLKWKDGDGEPGGLKGWSFKNLDKE